MSKKKPIQDCRSYEDLISEWVFEDSVDEKTLAPVKGHIKTCESCKSLKQEYEILKQPLSDNCTPPPPAPKDLKTTVMTQILSQGRKRSTTFPLTFISVAASILVVVTVCLYQFSDLSKNYETDALSVNQKIVNRNKSDNVTKEEISRSNNADRTTPIKNNAGQNKLLVEKNSKRSQLKEKNRSAETQAESEAIDALEKPTKPKPIEESNASKDQITTEQIIILKVKTEDIKNFELWCKKNNFTHDKIDQTTKDEILKALDYKEYSSQSKDTDPTNRIEKENKKQSSEKTPSAKKAYSLEKTNENKVLVWTYYKINVSAIK